MSLESVSGIPMVLMKLQGVPRPMELHDAAGSGDTAAIKRLIAAGFDVNATNSSGDTPLHKAAANNHSNSVRTLAAAHAQIEVTNNDGMTPWHCAAQNGHVRVIKALCENGAHIHL